MKCYAIYCYENEFSYCADCLAGVYFDRDYAYKVYGDGNWTFGKAEIKEFEVTPELKIEMIE